MVLSTRISIQWLPDEPSELTSTLVSTSASDHFVDVRILKDKYPHVQQGPEPENFEDVFDWVITGEEQEIPGTSKIQFNHAINLQEIMNSLKTGIPLLECKSAPDIGDFSAIDNSEDRKETGSMVNPETGKMTPYVEIWRSLNPEKSTPSSEIREGKDENGQKYELKGSLINWTYDLNEGTRYGRIIRLANWVQGIVHDKSEKTHPISVMRAYFDQSCGKFIYVIKYGLYEFPDIQDTHCIEAKGWKKLE